MAALNGLGVIVAGAGVFGLTTALALARAGATVTVHDPAPLGDNASGVAAGMLAPAMEAGLDGTAAGRFDLLRQARDLWPVLLSSLDVSASAIDRSGALFVGDEAASAGLLARLRAAGAGAEMIPSRHAETLADGLRVVPGRTVVFTPEDWRLDAQATLEALARGFAAAGGRFSSEAIVPGPGLPSGADVLVVASGMESAAWTPWLPEAAALQPIKGQILHFEDGPRGGSVVRTPGGYVAPQARGALAGATMEPGVLDRTVDPDALAKLRANAQDLFPRLRDAPARGWAGVRAATPDGLPLVGASSAASRRLLCTGARRNGWLLAPMAARIIVAILSGDVVGPAGLELSPRRLHAPGSAT